MPGSRAEASQFGFTIDYMDSAGNLRYYEPDFVAVLKDGSHRLLETKGREDPDVPVAIGQILSDEGIEVLLATETLRVNGRHAIPRCVKKSR